MLTYHKYMHGKGRAVGLSLVLMLVVSGVMWGSTLLARAQESLSQGEAEEIREDINDRQSKIQRLEEEISQYQQRLNELSGEKRTLQNEIERLEVTERKLEADIALVQNKIDATREEIESLTGEIRKTEAEIQLGREAVAHTVRQAYKKRDTSLLEALIAHGSLSGFWSEIDTILSFQSSVTSGVEELEELERELESQRQEQESLQEKQIALRNELEEQEQLVVMNKEEQAELLEDTEGKEERFQNLLQERVARKEAFEKELRELESQLQIAIDPGAIPNAGTGVLSWPVKDVVITQYFGNTAFATDNPQVYNGNGHNGVDLGISVGTHVKAAASGVVKGTGNTDLTCRGASYGKWVLVEHNNGLSTLYAHLSLIDVAKGQNVSRGETIARSGNTGYSTGPHLHFTVYATQGVQIADLMSRACGGTYTLPLADPDAYLNPLSFL